MTPQSLFDLVITALRAQGCKSTASVNGFTQCAYRSPQLDGPTLKCAAGHVLPDALYDPSMEGKVIDSVVCKDAFESVVGASNMALLVSLQRVHDHYLPSQWETKWADIAGQYRLTYAPILP